MIKSFERSFVIFTSWLSLVAALSAVFAPRSDRPVRAIGLVRTKARYETEAQKLLSNFFLTQIGSSKAPSVK